MKNKKGFTLIELLAVIVILAVIMVIAVPQILNVIEKSKESAAESSIKLVKDAIKTQVSTEVMSGTTFEKSGGCYTFDFNNQESGNAKTLSLKNKEKIGGSIRYCSGIFKNNTLTFDGKDMASSDPKVCRRATSLHEEECNRTDSNGCIGAGYSNGATITYGNLGTSGTLSSGDAFDCDVNGDGTYDKDTERFYYVTDLEENNVAVLIYYNNIKGNTASNSANIAYDSTNGTDASAQNWHGPISAITNLPKTSDWKNVGLTKEVRAITNENGENTTTNGANTISSIFSYEGYAARLLTVQEVNKTCGITIGRYTTGELDNCNYLMENTKYSSDKIGTYGYWLENPLASTSSHAWRVGGSTRRRGGDYYYVSYAGGYGVRPAIEVLKSDIEY